MSAAMVHTERIRSAERMLAECDKASCSVVTNDYLALLEIDAAKRAGLEGEVETLRDALREIKSKSAMGPYSPPRPGKDPSEIRWYNTLIKVSEIAQAALEGRP